MSVVISENQNPECDVLIVGGGASGSVAAITAHDEGSNVLVVEKMPALGGNCGVSGGNMSIATDMKFADYLTALAFKRTEYEINETLVRGSMKIPDWIRKNGGDVIRFVPLTIGFPRLIAGAGFPKAPGAQYMVKYNIKEKEGEEAPPGTRLWHLLKENLERRRIRTITNAPVKEILKNQRGEVVGVIAEISGKRVPIKANKAVILTTGSFENDEALKWEYLPCKPTKFLGSPGNTGDGVKLAQKAGGALWHMGIMGTSIGFQAAEYEAAFPIRFLNMGFIFVSKYGKRFMAEVGLEIHDYSRFLSSFDPNKLEYPYIPAHAIFGEQVRRMGPLASDTVGINRELYKWSEDNKAEIAKGWIRQAKSIAELSSKISVDESTLRNTLERYNGDCKVRLDSDFGRLKESLVSIEGPPYYSIDIWPTMYSCVGGPRRDKEARVLDPDGIPIPRLYAAGENGGVLGMVSEGGICLVDSIVFGQIAGRNAAAEKSIVELA